MHNYEALLNQKADMPEIKIIQKDIECADSWEKAYWIGKYMFEQASGEADKLIMDAYEKALRLGLNIRVNREHFLSATQELAHIYFQFRKYEEAVNKLMVLDAHIDNLPDWVNLYYAAAQIHTDNVLYWAEMPEILFKRIDGINEEDCESVRRRKYLFLEFLNRISELAKTKDVSKVNKNAILSKAAELELLETPECMNFKYAFGIISILPEFQVESDTEIKPGDEKKRSSVCQHITVELNKRLSELQTIVDQQTLEIAQYKKRLYAQGRLIISLQNEKKTLESNEACLTEEVKRIRENEYALLARCRALESSLSGRESEKIQLEEDAVIISGLQTDVEDLKIALTVSQKNNTELRADIVKDKEIIESLNNELLMIQEETKTLYSIIESQKAQIEIADAAVKVAEEKSLTEQRKQTVTDLSEEYVGNAVQPNRLEILSVENFLPRKQKILIIGGSETKEKNLRGKLKSMGFNFSKDQLEFELDYSNIKDYASRIRQWSGKYAGIIVGPCPHKAKDINGYSSFIEQIKSEQGYPHVEEARDKSGMLKISNASIGDAMMKMAVYLQSIA